MSRGVWIVVAGPDGTGKSTLCDALIAGPLSRYNVIRMHHRPGVLRSRSSLGPVTDPHGAKPYSRAVSLLKAMYLWLDFALGANKIARITRSGGIVVMERGWWDLVADPLRYRLNVSPGLLARIGRTLKLSDRKFVLEVPVTELAERKLELPEEEIGRQAAFWRTLGDERTQFVDGTRPVEQVRDEVAKSIVRMMEDRRLAPAGWASLPRRSGRFVIPRGPRSLVTRALRVYHPMSVRGAIAWRAASAAARLGLFHLLPRSAPPEESIVDAARELLTGASGFAVARGSRPGRTTMYVVARPGDLVVHVATTQEARAGLLVKAKTHAHPELPAPLIAPSVVAQTPDALAVSAAEWQPRMFNWRLPEDVARAAGRLWRETGEAHGDFAPWNLLRVRNGWMLIDWESRIAEAAPFEDVAHWIVQAHTHYGKPSLGAIAASLKGRGWAGRALTAYADGAGLSVADAGPALHGMARRLAEQLPEQERRSDMRVMAARRLLVRKLDERGGA